MNGQNHGKLQYLLQSWPTGTVTTTKWLSYLGISRQLTNAYKTRNWIKLLENGAYIKPQDKIDWFGGLYALQFQLNLDIHVGGKTALEIQGIAHNIPVGHQTIDLLMAPKTKIPRWFSRHPWQERIRITENNALPKRLELQETSVGNFNIKVSSRERAALELLCLTPRFYNFEETRILMESLGTLRASILTKLLSVCTSEKARRLLLYFGEEQKHAWRSKLDERKFKVGSSLLKIASKNGKYNAKYNLILPQEYVIENDKSIEF